jgi:hypothetical protein
MAQQVLSAGPGTAQNAAAGAVYNAKVAGRYGRLDLLSLDGFTRSARKSSQLR